MDVESECVFVCLLDALQDESYDIDNWGVNAQNIKALHDNFDYVFNLDAFGLFLLEDDIDGMRLNSFDITGMYQFVPINQNLGLGSSRLIEFDGNNAGDFLADNASLFVILVDWLDLYFNYGDKISADIQDNLLSGFVGYEYWQMDTVDNLAVYDQSGDALYMRLVGTYCDDYREVHCVTGMSLQSFGGKVLAHLFTVKDFSVDSGGLHGELYYGDLYVGLYNNDDCYERTQYHYELSMYGGNAL